MAPFHARSNPVTVVKNLFPHTEADIAYDRKAEEKQTVKVERKYDKYIGDLDDREEEFSEEWKEETGDILDEYKYEADELAKDRLQELNQIAKESLKKSKNMKSGFGKFASKQKAKNERDFKKLDGKVAKVV